MLYHYKAVLDRVVDADTIDVVIKLGFEIDYKTRLRLNGINAPEVSTPEGKLAKSWLTAQLPVGTELEIKTYKDKGDKFGRFLADVLVLGTNMNEELVKQGHAVLYDGGKR